MAKNKISIIRYFFLLTALLFSANSMAMIKLPAIFSDHMVLQQKTKVRIWGWASPGEQVSLSAQWQSKDIRTMADDSGNWEIILQTPAASGPYNIKINGKNFLEIEDVLIGEVWFCSGQSNMTFPLKYSNKAKEEIASADYPSIRYFGVKKQYGQKPFEDCGGSAWEKTSPETAPSFSAVAYYFAKKIHQAVKVPVGIVCAAWGGTPAEAWTPKNVLKKDDSLHYYLRRWSDIPQLVGEDSVKYRLAVSQWEKNKISAGGAVIGKPEEPRIYYYYKRPWCEPGVLFNGMINPVIPYTVKGVLWYQGESNVSEADNYEHLFTTMIKSWRNQWRIEGGQKVLPFYFVQIAPFAYNNLDAAARLRQAQYEVMKKVDYTGMAVTVDVGNMKNIHYTHKKETGDRLALIALAKSYGFKDIIYEGPDCKKIVKVNNKLQLTFDQQLFTIGQQKPQGFEIGYKGLTGDSVLFVKAKSIIEGDKVIVWNDGVKDPLIVRYAWLNIAEANLINKAGLPAYPFKKGILHRN